MTSCPGRTVIKRFVAGTASRCERREIVRHLLAECGTCAASLRSAWRPPIEEKAYDGALARRASRFI